MSHPVSCIKSTMNAIWLRYYQKPSDGTQRVMPPKLIVAPVAIKLFGRQVPCLQPLTKLLNLDFHLKLVKQSIFHGLTLVCVCLCVSFINISAKSELILLQYGPVKVNLIRVKLESDELIQVRN